MEQIKVSELASEFELKDTRVISELKKIGVWVPSPDTAVDSDIANRIRRRLQLIVELEQEEQAKAEKAKDKKVKAPTSRARRTIKELGKPRKRAARPEPEQPVESPLAGSLKPRKGKASYRRIEQTEEPQPEKVEITIEDEPVIEKVEAKVPAELVESAKADGAQVEQTAPAEKAETAAEEEAVSEPAGTEAGEKVEAKDMPVVAQEGAQKTPSPPPIAQPPRRPVLPAARRPAAGEAPKMRPRPSQRPPAPARPVAPRPPVREAPKTAAVAAKAKERPLPSERPEFAETREITLTESVTVKELAERIGVKSKDVVRELMKKGVMATINQRLDQKTAEEVCLLFNAVPRFVTFEERVIEEQQVADQPDDLVQRAPVVTVMGHVDHGKTSLLDAIRETKVAAGEAGGITQHIGAYHVEVKNRKIVFLDTPGHEAFTLMRARGAQATDIVVLVVAADDGVMPQTREAIDHARAAKVPILVAVNKIDKPDAQPQRVKQSLSDLGLQPEDWGGDTVMVEVSAKEKVNLDLLLEMILLIGDMLDLKANPNRPAHGVILEAKLDKGRGAVATVLVQNGGLKVGDSFIAGTSYGRIRAMFDDRGRAVTSVGPSSAVEILGLQGMPQAGDGFQVVEDTTKARQIGEYRLSKIREKEMTRSSRLSLDELYAQMQSHEVKELPIVLKGDAQGSVEVVRETLRKLSTEKVKVNVIHAGVGAISESDVLLASASNAIVIGFNVRPEQNAHEVAEREGVDVRPYTVIYDISVDIQKAMVGLLDPTLKETVMGRAEVRETFRVPKVGVIAGCYVLEGEVRRNAEARLIRDNVVVFESRIGSLRRFKEDVSQVRAGYECGLSIANFNDIKIGDVVEVLIKEEVTPELS